VITIRGENFATFDTETTREIYFFMNPSAAPLIIIPFEELEGVRGVRYDAITLKVPEGEGDEAQVMVAITHKRTLKIVQSNHVIGEEFYLKIVIACNDYKINQNEGQYPQRIQLMCNGKYELQPFNFASMGSQYVSLKHENIKIPFRKPRKTEESVVKAFEKFIIAYKQTIYDNMPNLAHQDKVDYKSLF
jgi:hypothetical protein